MHLSVVQKLHAWVSKGIQKLCCEQASCFHVNFVRFATAPGNTTVHGPYSWHAGNAV